ncbi:MAG TPA: glycosyltransferase [Bryobacteraceae bacterium]|nr:glycosyltransferase [Bryobacteraceae bacterium]
MSLTAYDGRPVDIIVPFYKNAHLVSSLFQSLEQAPVPLELSSLRASLILVNDSPGDRELRQCLQSASAAMGAHLPYELLNNDQNAGFLRSVNRALELSVEREHDAIILNSDTLVTPGALAEMCGVARTDPMIGFVSPRSNNATICSLPHQEQYRAAAPQESNAYFRQLSKYLPRFHFLPVGVGFCLFIRWEVLAEFGLLDEAYRPAYNEENDLMLRANRCGYRAALANRAWVYHIGEASHAGSPFSKRGQETKNAALLNERYPEYKPSIRRYFKGAHFEGELALAGLLPDVGGRQDLLFDFSSFGLYHNGTFVASKKVLQRASKLWPQFNLYVMISEDAWKFHELGEIPRVRFVPLHVRRKFAVVFRFGQPFSFDQMYRANRLAPVNVYGMFDPIAFDCLYLNSKNPDDLETLWAAVFAHADGVIYISDFVAELFRRRFPLRPGLPELVAYPSLDFRDYRNGDEIAGPSEQHILVIGNRFEHKRVLATADALTSAFPQEKLVVLGCRYEKGANVRSFESGTLDENQMRELLAGARFVVFPSTYEGFGFPVLESLAWSKPVLARSIAVIRAIREKTGAGENLILYSSTCELIARLKQGFPQWRAGSGREHGDTTANWDAAAVQIGEFISERIRSLDFENVLLPRLRHMHALGQQAERTGGGAIRLYGTDMLAAALEDREAQIRDIRGSWSWRVTAPMRRLASAYLHLRKRDRPNTR